MRYLFLLIFEAWITMAVAAEDQTVFPPYAKPTLIAHRGASGEAPEHTVAAYELALKYGADFVEPDLQMTKDGVLVCLHDTTLDRTTDVARVYPDRAVIVEGKKSWPVVEFTLEEIQKLDAGSWKAPKYAGSRVPTFQQMIDLVKGRAGIMPETKAPELYGKHGLNMEKTVMDLLKANQLDSPGMTPMTPVIIQSASAESLKVLYNKQHCRLPLVFLMAGGTYFMEHLETIKEFADGIAPSKSVVTSNTNLVNDAHALRMSVTVWTFRTGQTGTFKSVHDEMDYYLKTLKVDAVFTDNPDQFPRD